MNVTKLKGRVKRTQVEWQIKAASLELHKNKYAMMLRSTLETHAQFLDTLLNITSQEDVTPSTFESMICEINLQMTIEIAQLLEIRDDMDTQSQENIDRLVRVIKHHTKIISTVCE